MDAPLVTLPTGPREKLRLALAVNGEDRELLVDSYKTLLEVLREDLGLTGTKHGCELGECGACAVLLDGELVLSCLVAAVECSGRAVTTIEGLRDGPELHPLQAAQLPRLRHHAAEQEDQRRVVEPQQQDHHRPRPGGNRGIVSRHGGRFGRASEKDLPPHIADRLIDSPQRIRPPWREHASCPILL